METSKEQPRRTNRRSAVRRPLRSDTRVECRKGSMGLGPNITQAFLDLSQSGVRLVVKAPLKKREEAEVIISSSGTKQIKRIATVVWSVPTDNDFHVVGLQFYQALSYAEVQGTTKP